MSDNYFYIDNPSDVYIVIDLLTEAVTTGQLDYNSYMGGIIMPLPDNKCFDDELYIRNMKTRLMEFKPVVINKAYCGLCASIENGKVKYLCHALNENEGYYTDESSSLGSGIFLPITTDIEIVKIALFRFFSLDDFESQDSDSLTRTVHPGWINDKH